MSYRKERETFLVAFTREFPEAKTYLAERLLRIATGSQRYNEITCSIDVGERELARMEKREENRMVKARLMAELAGTKLIENGDPRGFPLFLALPEGRPKYDMGDRGLGVPGRGLPASAFQ